jgi:hypothetical protein
MGVSSLRVTEYYISCDGEGCICCDCISDIQSEIRGRQEAIKKAGFHKLADGRILCEVCFKKYRTDRK